MGVPSFYRWLVGKYPAIVSPANERHDDDDDDVGASSGSNGAVPVYHNLYLDMNGIIHPCFHPQDQVCPPTTLEEVFEAMFDYMDLLFRIVRPTRLLYLAEVEENLLRDRFRAEGKKVLPREASSEVSDPNVITPGTEFMDKLSDALKYYIRALLNSDPLWKDINVILSDANVPGEGEHKIMSFIRAQRGREGYDPNTRHCLYGLDADLIMLALASHEVHFSILREEVLDQNNQENTIPITPKTFTSQEAAKFKCRAWFHRITEARTEGKLPKKPYQFLNIWVLREYLELDMKIPNPVQTLDIERIIDDFVFICFLTGNDFIPHIPSLEIHEGAIDLLIEVYKTSFNKMGGYIVDTDKVKDKHAAYLKVSRLEKFFHELSLYEEKIFLKRCQLRENFQRKIERQAAENAWNERNSENVITMNTLELRKKMKDILHNKQDLIKSGACKHDKIKLGSPGWKSRFFKEKFGAEPKDEIAKLQNEMVTFSCFLNYANGIQYLTVQKYLEGLCWVLCYYFADVPSWSWYYPFYYAPFASDVKGLSRSFALPGCYRKLMDSDESVIQAFYPSDLDIDTDGKRYLWQVHELKRNTVRQEKIFLRNSNALANNEAFAPTSDRSLQKLPIDPATNEIGGWLSPDDDDSSNGFCSSPIENDLSISAKFFNPEAVKPATRLLHNVTVPDKSVTEADISARPLWHTHPYPNSKHPALSMPNMQQQRLQSSRPETPCWKPSTPPPRREEIRSAGTGWLGRGRGGNNPVAVTVSSAAEARQSWSSSRYVRGRGSGATAVGHGKMTPRHQWSGGGGGYGRSSGVDNGGGRGSYNLRPGGGGGSGGSYQWQQQKTAWRPVGSPWGRGGGGDGGNGQPRAW
uniref:5'-3' exoribonuclease n=1 Tax=Oryza punctata TaxID=4537 RepID=A0A0E0MCN4_ORYPU